MKLLTVLLFPSLLFGAGIDFKQSVLPILQERCISCHSAPYTKSGRLRKPKGDYRVDTRENIVKAGDSEKVAVVPGDASNSNLYKLILLSEDHDDIMPAKGDPLTDEQKETVKNWINQGAKWTPGVVINRK